MRPQEECPCEGRADVYRPIVLRLYEVVLGEPLGMMTPH
jgi:hypothetical protein